MTAVWGILISAGSGTAGFYVGMRIVGVNLARILAKLDDAQLAKLADQVIEERKRGHTG